MNKSAILNTPDKEMKQAIKQIFAPILLVWFRDTVCYKMYKTNEGLPLLICTLYHKPNLKENITLQKRSVSLLLGGAMP